MKKLKILYLIPLLLLGGILLASNYSNKKSDYISLKEKTIHPPKNKDNFDKMMDVLTHPRCMNCHPSDNIPKQGIESHPHYFGMEGGKNDQGFEATKCMTCHQTENNNYSGVPGAPHWGLAPQSMAWKGLTRQEIAAVMLNKETNGGKNHEEIIKHLTEDDLVLWAWNPGVNAAGIKREKPPVSQEEFKEVVEAWFADGAIIPEK
ncbi:MULTISPECIES: hypothetical protein [unclassified Polaribacter]|uniref:hypothetical protein n=1 Tax=unclassified Polaribacter TaxID=196858 RepID=UPI0011BEAEDB|nr:MULTISPECIES: hypothetical protein [unclassified Polaribacter]TXD52683.1 hypothetical protein ES043_07540 [Polaribacter sp. IC063]TXD60651.1 hypothetical protein ES044_07070 [Polaribacter sp. IC066]